MMISKEKVDVATLILKNLMMIPKDGCENVRTAAGDRILFTIENDGTVVLKKALLVSAE